MIKYENIELIPIEMEDLELLKKWKNDDEVFKYLGGGYRPISENQAQKWVESLINNNHQYQRFMIKNDKKIGFIGLYNISEVNRTAELGIYIGEKEYQGKGFATMAYKALENYAKDWLNIRKINLEVVKDNTRAIKLYEKLDFKVCGNRCLDRFVEGEYRDVVMMEKFINIKDVLNKEK